MTSDTNSVVASEEVEQSIFLVRGERVILDCELAALYGVGTKRINEQVRRNSDRFPSDFAFRLTSKEAEILRSHFATSSSNWGGRRTTPWAFTEHGALMAASVLSTPRAVQMSVFVVRAFVRLRRLIAENKELFEKIAALERKLSTHDRQILAIVDAIKRLASQPEPRKTPRIGY
jgi:hypothetical protein